MKQWFLVFVTFFHLCLCSSYAAVLAPEEAFKIASSQAKEGVFIHVSLGEGIYLYNDKIAIEIIEPKKVTLTHKSVWPKAELYHGEMIQRGTFDLFIPDAILKEAMVQDAFKITFSYQGCSEIGICYSPMSKTLVFGTTPNTLSEQDEIAYRLSTQHTGMILLLFFGFGLLLALTPCIFPMVPILSSLIVSQPRERMNAKQGFFLSLVYVLAMSFTYAIAGLVVSLLGANIQAFMQHPFVIVLFSAFFVALALSMFGFYEIKMPSFLQTNISKKIDQTRGVGGIAIMGFLSALIVGPCVAPPLAGALIYISHSGDMWLGGSALFVMSLGMGVPLLIVGTTAGKYMPRPGAWMRIVSSFFGVALLAVAIWMLSRVIPDTITMGLWAMLCVSSAVYAGALEPLEEGASRFRKLFKSLFFILLVYGVTLCVGFISGATDPLNPLEKLSSRNTPLSKNVFTKVDSFQTLQNELANAEKIVMLDFYADWCVNCVEYEKFTFSDVRVKEKMQHMKLLKADVTKNSEEDKAMQKAFGIFGPPALLFFKNGKELKELRLVGYKNADEFLSHLEKVGI